MEDLSRVEAKLKEIYGLNKSILTDKIQHSS